MPADYNDIKVVLDKYKNQDDESYYAVIDGIGRFIRLTYLLNKGQGISNAVSERAHLESIRRFEQLKHRHLSYKPSEADIFNALKQSASLCKKLLSWRASANNMQQQLDLACQKLANQLIEIDKIIVQSRQQACWTSLIKYHSVSLGQTVYQYSPIAPVSMILDWGNQKMNVVLPKFCLNPIKAGLIIIGLMMFSSELLANPTRLIMLFLLPAIAASIHYVLPSDKVNYQQAIFVRSQWKPSVAQIQLLQSILISSAIAGMTNEYRLITQTLVTMGVGMTAFFVGERITQIAAHFVSISPIDQFVLSKMLALAMGYIGYCVADSTLDEVKLRRFIHRRIEQRQQDADISLVDIHTSIDDQSIFSFLQHLLWFKPAQVEISELDTSGRITIFSCTLDDKRFGKSNPLDCQFTSSALAISYSAD